MSNLDQETILRAVADVRRILAEPDARLTTRTIDRLIALLDRDDVVRALNRMKRRTMLRVVD